MNNNYQHIYEQCKNYMHSYVLAELVDGTKVDGIITGVDEEYVYFAIPIGGDEHASPSSSPYGYPPYRQFGGYGGGYGYPGHGYPGYGYHGYGYPGYGYGGRPGRFRRLVLPLAALTALSVLPWY